MFDSSDSEEGEQDLNSMFARLSKTEPDSNRSEPQSEDASPPEFASDSSSSNDTAFLDMILEGKKKAGASDDGLSLLFDAESSSEKKRHAVSAPKRSCKVLSRKPRPKGKSTNAKASTEGPRTQRSDTRTAQTRNRKSWSVNAQPFSLEKSELDLAIALLDYNIQKQDETWSEKYRQTAREAAKTLRSEGVVLPSQLVADFEAIAVCGGYQQLPEDEDSRRMVESNRAVLLENARGLRSGHCVERVVEQHLAATRALFRKGSQWTTDALEKDLTILEKEYSDWRNTWSGNPRRDNKLLRSLTQGAGMGLRARIWSILGWSRTATFNSQLGPLTYTAQTSDEASYDLGSLRQTSMNHAAAVMALLFRERNRDEGDNGPEDGLTAHVLQSLCLLRNNWQNSQWHVEGNAIALTHFQDMYGQVAKNKGLRAETVMKSINCSHAKNGTLRNATAIHNIRILCDTGRATATQWQWKRNAAQLGLNAEYLRRRACATQDPVAKFSEGGQILLEVCHFDDEKTEPYLEVLMKPEIIEMRNFVQSQLQEHMVGWEDDSMQSEGEDLP